VIDRFELFVARRYLGAKRKQAMISVITVISILGVAAGVMSLVIALAINNGFRSTLQNNLLGATAHVTVLEKAPGPGIENWREVTAKLQKIPHVTSAAPTLYGAVYMSGPIQSTGGILKGIDVNSGPQMNDVLRHLKAGSLRDLDRKEGLPGIILGTRLAQQTGMMPGSILKVLSPDGEMTPFGPRPNVQRFKVVGLFESGFYELDATWAFVTLKAAQDIFSLSDVVNAVELKLDDINLADQVAAEVDKLVGPKLAATTWMEQNKPILNALRMERIVTFITIGLLQTIGALNILIALIMMVMEKHKDIAILMSMGARHRQIRRVFVLEGLIIGSIGTALGLAVGYTISYLADKYQWIHLDEQVYSLAYVPFDARPADALWIAAIALFISFIATLYPARNATRVAPVEALRYE
jgi:lipoprotein-releasing system permease protein